MITTPRIHLITTSKSAVQNWTEKASLQNQEARVSFAQSIEPSLLSLVKRGCDAILCDRSLNSKQHELLTGLAMTFPDRMIRVTRLSQSPWQLLSLKSDEWLCEVGERICKSFASQQRQSFNEEPIANRRNRVFSRHSSAMGGPNCEGIRRQDRGHALGNGISGVSLKSWQKFTHDLKTPLTVMRGYTDILDGESIGDLNFDQRCVVQKIKVRIDEVDSQINDFFIGL